MLQILTTVHVSMLAHAREGLPNEACGLFAGPFGSCRVERFFPMANAAASSQIYTLDGRELLDVERRADDEGTAIMGVMHSHTHTTAYPSPTDVADAARFDPFGAWIFVIVSLKHAEPALRAYRILEGKISEEPVELVDG